MRAVEWIATTRAQKGFWSLGRLAPTVLAVWFLVDLGLRFAPAEWLNLRPVLVAVRFPKPYAPFQPGLQLRTANFIGEAALEGNVATREQRPPLNFSTDHLGFRRNPFFPEGHAPDVLVWRGASFGYGAALSDEETFAAQLTTVSGLRTYNGSRFSLDPDGLPELDWLLRRLPSTPKVAVYLHLEHTNPGTPQDSEVEVLGFETPDPRQSLQLRYAKRVINTWKRLSPFKILSTRFAKSLSNDRLLPNPYRKNLRMFELPDGSQFLIRNYEFESSTRSRSAGHIRSSARKLMSFRDELRKRGMQVIIVLIPSRHTMYAPWFKNLDGTETPARHYLDTLELELSREGVDVVNGLSVLRTGIEDEIRTGDLSFYRDDNHWTPKGVRRVAESVSRILTHRVATESVGLTADPSERHALQ